MRTQIEKNRDALLEEIEQLREKPLTNQIAEKLCIYGGALEALRAGHGAMEAAPVVAPLSAPEPRYATRQEPTMELDGDTEFERAIMAMPIDWEHMERLVHVFAIHMENLAFANKRAYNKILDQIEQIASS